MVSSVTTNHRGVGREFVKKQIVLVCNFCMMARRREKEEKSGKEERIDLSMIVVVVGVKNR